MRRVRRRRGDDDFAAEIESHLQSEIDQLVAEGLSPEEARVAARRAFGNVTLTRERFHESRRIAWIEDLRRDVEYATRHLAANPLFTLSVAGRDRAARRSSGPRSHFHLE